MPIDQEKSLLPRFVFAKSVSTGKQARMRRNYRRSLEIAMIFSIIISIFLTRWSPNWKMINKHDELSIDPFVVIDIPLFEEERPPPPPITEPFMEEQIIVDEIQVITEEEKEEPVPALDLKIEIETPVLLDSQIGDDFKTRINDYRKWQISSSKLSLPDKYGRGHSPGESELDLAGKSKTTRARGNRDSGSKVDLQINTKTSLTSAQKGASKGSASSIIEHTADENVVILKPPKSTLALTEYRMWSKLSGQLDRIDKRIFDNTIPNLKKSRDGIRISFRFKDGIQHDIFWRKGGKTSIRVIGKNRKTSLEELQRALSALLQFTLNK